MNIKMGVLLMCLLSLVGCKEAATETVSGESKSCRGVYVTRDAQGNLKKYNEYYNASAKSCYTDTMSLSQWEKTSEAWDKNQIQCSPQLQFSSRTLVSANNYYSYRDGKTYLDLDSSTGIFRRIVIGEDRSSNPTFTRLQGCFYQRTGQGVDAAFGSQLLLDTEITKIKTSEVFDPWEIFRYTETATSLEMTRFDASDDWDFSFCPDSSTPWGFCDLARNGNIYYYPTLSGGAMASLLAEALLIRKQFNYKVISKSDFDSQWVTIENTNEEGGRNDWKYMVNGLVDTPRYVDQAWHDYLTGDRPHMPVISTNQMPPLCYEGFRDVVLSDGSTAKVFGEICYENGNYFFTE